MTPVSLHAADTRARERALHPEQSFLVQAPAGSGKTELLMQRYLRLLAIVARPEAIVAITFTIKAAAEMRSRILEALRSASGPEPELPHKQLTWQLARQALDNDQRHDWRLLQNPNRLKIQTIDAFNSSIVRQMPWLSRMGASFHPEEDARWLYREAASATMELLADPALGPRLATFLKHRDNNVPFAIDLLADMLAKREQWLRHVGASTPDADYSHVRAHLERTLAGIVERELQATYALIPPHLLPEMEQFIIRSSRDLEQSEWHARQHLEPASEALPAWWEAIKCLTTGECREIRARSSAAISGLTDFERKRFDQLLKTLRTTPNLLAAFKRVRKLPSPRYDDGQWQLIEALLAVLPIAVAQLQILFQQRGTVDFPAIAYAALRALGPEDELTDLGMLLGERLEHLLIDEFQDTSVSQLLLIRALTRGWDQEPSRTLFLVGDPMQSIYRFRQAEVGLFLSAESSVGLPLERLQLTRNFRSDANIVDWNNAAFAKVFPQQQDIASGMVPFHPSVAARETRANAEVRVHPFLIEDPEAEARTVAEIVQHAQGSTAILVRARTHLNAILPELAARGLRYRGVDVESLANRPVVQDLKALTRALTHLGDRTAWLALLRSPMVGLTLADLHALAASTPATLWSALQTRAPEAAQPFVASMRHALDLRGSMPLARLVEQTWLALRGPATISSEADWRDAMRFLQLLQSLSEGASITSFSLLEERVADLFAEPDLEAPESLQIMTIHKAKGLEFDNVIVPGLGRSSGQPDMDLLRFEEYWEGEERGLLVAARAPTGADADPIYTHLTKLEKERESQEARRLLYVACTRAKCRLHLLGHVTQQGKPAQDALLSALWPAVETHFYASQGHAPVPQPDAPEPRKSRLLRRLPAGYRVPEPPVMPPRRVQKHVVETANLSLFD